MFTLSQAKITEMIFLNFLAILALFGCSALSLNQVQAAGYTIIETAEKRTVIRGSGLAVPRFVSTKKEIVNMRVGPGQEYPLEWVYVRKNIPLKVISEFNVWRKIIDHEGATGWIHTSLLSSKRYGMITKSGVKLRATPHDAAPIRAIADSGVMMKIQYCKKEWCQLAQEQIKGWTRRNQFWGVLPDETLN